MSIMCAMSITNAKYSQGKPPVGDLIAENPAAFEQLAYVVKFAMIKYGIPTGFLYMPGGFAVTQIQINNSIQRHMVRPFSNDHETGQPHIVMALTELMLLRESAVCHAANGTYKDEAKAFYGDSLYQQMNNDAIAQKDPAVWTEKWTEAKADMLARPYTIPMAQTLMRTPVTIDQMAHARQEYQEQGSEMSVNEKFIAAAYMLQNTQDGKLYKEQKANPVDMAAYLLLNVVQDKYPDPKIFLK